MITLQARALAGPNALVMYRSDLAVAVVCPGASATACISPRQKQSSGRLDGHEPTMAACRKFMNLHTEPLLRDLDFRRAACRQAKAYHSVSKAAWSCTGQRVRRLAAW